MKNLFRQYKVHLLLFLFGLFTLHVSYQPLANGLDSSWVYALNLFSVTDHVKFGRDVVFTYGPLGWLQGPVFPHNFLQSTVLTALLWAGSLVLFYKLIRRPGCNGFMVGLGLLFLFCGIPFNNISTDVYFPYYVLLALAVLWEDAEDRFAAAYFCLCCTISFLHKFTLTVALTATLILYVLSRFWRKETKTLWPLLLPFFLFPLYYLLYNPSLRDFWSYLKGSWEISSGFSTGMSISSFDSYAYGFFLLIALYIIIMLCQLASKNAKNFLMMLWFAPCLFISYKHGFVRADAPHIMSACAELLTLLSLIVLLFDVQGLYADLVKGSWRGLVQGGFILTFLAGALLGEGIVLQPWTNLTENILTISDAVYNIQPERYAERLNGLDTIPYEFIADIGDSTFTCYPTEITAAVNAQDRFLPLYTLQAYQAYTPYLDNRTAEKLSGEGAPQFIVFSYSLIDDRLPYLETPATWKAIIENYHLTKHIDSYFLWERNDPSAAGSLAPASPKRIETSVVSKSDTIYFDGCSEVRIYMDLTLKGKLAKLLWKIPAINGLVRYASGAETYGRVIPDNLRNNITVEYLPFRIENEEEDWTAVEITFFGSGLDYYDDEIRVERIYN